MAVYPKRKRPAASYRDSSSDDDDVDDASDSEPVAAKRRRTPQRRSTRHQQPPTEHRALPNSQPESSHTRPPAPSPPNEARLRERHTVTYHESSSSEGDHASDDESAIEPSLPPPRKKAKPRPTTSPNKQKVRTTVRARKALGAPLKRRGSTSVEVQSSLNPIVSDGNIPSWATLPYHILLQIFVYAAHPLHDETMAPMPSISWLAKIARTCTAFTKPALTALYRNPPIFALQHRRGDLVNHLISPPANAHGDYQVMAKRIELDGTRMSKLTGPANSTADLASLVLALTTLKEIEIFDPIDKPPFRERSKPMRRWTYPDELFQALRQSTLRLKAWRWTSTFCAHNLLWMKSVHSESAFQSLREVTLTKFQAETSHPHEDEPTTEELLGSALAVLPKLATLTFESCTVVNARLLSLLPTTLLSLTLTNCKELNSETLNPFLVTHGSRLEVLNLNNNQCLDMSFVVDLKLTCPRLEELRMDLNYYNSFSTSHDNEPLYDELLGEGDIPTWPSSLRLIELMYLRNWSPNAAKAFFSSLIESAKDLPHLREITILASVDIEWRKRAEYREKWTGLFEKVFTRRSTPPNSNLASLRSFREWRASQQNTDKNDSLIESEPEKDPGEESEDSDAPLLPLRKGRPDEKWGGRRLRRREKLSGAYAETSDEEQADSESGPTDEGEADGPADEGSLFIQGNCHTVSFRIDNLRPREQMFNEADFLDSESSEDGDWDGNDVVEETTLYAW
ncbi:hypothetical protein EJ04DRAFT_489106 [Polyplosphaeria fusca]|uniref:Uncharacterized protein n=1 Tax=Polyplosphaeria fusca TaxID=682080 RepID=A0A9P4V520_9PLEO|nr:hypothetical protein EJ04DRAFT_489106 [Polyplosphaeria fusca]